MSNKAIFLDRDDTLIEDPGYISNPEQLKLLEDVPKALKELKQLGYKLIVVSNQSAVARGIVTEKVLGEIHERLKQMLAKKGAYLDGIYYCPYHPEGTIPKYRRESDSRKPNPGMLLTAAEDMNLDLGQSWLIGNSTRDIQAGKRAGCKTILINSRLDATKLQSNHPNPDYTAMNIKEATNIIKKSHSHTSNNEATANIDPADPTESLPPAEDTKPSVQHDSQTFGQARQAKSKIHQVTHNQQEMPNNKTEKLLERVLEQLKNMQRTDMFTEFSVMRLIAGIVQIIVLFCLLVTIWLLMSPARQDSAVLIALGFAILFQVMALTFYIMQSRK
jgi:D-glycero-D-manno-heptose 1,7-bisphosphate phosphatase